MEKNKTKKSFDFMQFLNDFKKLSDAKQKQSLYMKLTIALASVVIVCAFTYANKAINTAMNKILVVNTGGQFLQVETDTQDKLYETLLTAHCAQTVYFANSFDRLSVKTNQARALFLCNQPDMNAVFMVYQNWKAYADCYNRGVVYRCDFNKIEQIKLLSSANEYKVIFSSTLTAIDGNNTKKWNILSEGIAIRTTPRYPENTTGFYFKNYNQQYVEVNQQ